MTEPKLEVVSEIVAVLDIDARGDTKLEIECEDIHVIEIPRVMPVLDIERDVLKVLEVAQQGPSGPAGPPGTGGGGSIDVPNLSLILEDQLV